MFLTKIAGKMNKQLAGVVEKIDEMIRKSTTNNFLCCCKKNVCKNRRINFVHLCLYDKQNVLPKNSIKRRR